MKLVVSGPYYVYLDSPQSEWSGEIKEFASITIGFSEGLYKGACKGYTEDNTCKIEHFETPYAEPIFNLITELARQEEDYDEA